MKKLILLKLTAVFLTIAASVLLSYSLKANSGEMSPLRMICDEETQIPYSGGPVSILNAGQCTVIAIHK